MMELLTKLTERIPAELLLRLLWAHWVWALAGAFLLIVAEFAFRKHIVAYLLARDRREHDTAIYAEWQRLLPESLLSEYVNGLLGDRSCLRTDIQAVEALLHYARELRHRYLFRELEKRGRRYTAALRALFEFGAVSMFVQGSGFYRLQPDWRSSEDAADRGRYRELEKQLDALVARVVETYKAFVYAATEALPGAIRRVEAISEE